MRQSFLKMTGFFVSALTFFTLNAQAEVGQLEDTVQAFSLSQSEGNLDLEGSEGLRLLAARDSDNAVDRAFNRMDKKRAKQQKYKYYYLLPLGIPQFSDGLRGIGSAVAVGQVGSLMLYYDRRKKVDSLNGDAATATRNLPAEQANANPGLLSFLNQNEKNVKDAQKEQRFFLYAFLGLYAFSVYEALYDPFAFRKVDSLRKKKRDRDRDRDDDKDDDDGDSAMERESRGGRNRFGFMVLPENKSYQLALSWQATLP